MIKNILFCFGIMLITTGCTTTIYEGSFIQPQNAMFNNANFKYVKTIFGNSKAVYNGFGYDKVRDSNGLINSAKVNMYETHTFMPNQIITNISKDVVKTFDKTRYQVKVIMSADVYEFSNNGIYSYEDKTNDLTHSNIEDKTNDLTHSNIEESPIKTLKTNTLESTNPLGEEYPDYIIFNNKKYSVGDEIVYIFSNEPAIIENFIRNKFSSYFYDVEININNIIRQTSLEYIN